MYNTMEQMRYSQHQSVGLHGSQLQKSQRLGLRVHQKKRSQKLGGLIFLHFLQFSKSPLLCLIFLCYYLLPSQALGKPSFTPIHCILFSLSCQSFLSMWKDDLPIYSPMCLSCSLSGSFSYLDAFYMQINLSFFCLFGDLVIHTLKKNCV